MSARQGAAPERWIREGTLQRAALRDPPQAAGVLEPPSVPTPRQPAPGVPAAPQGCPDPNGPHTASPRRCGPAAAPARALPALHSDSPAPAPGKVWWCGGRGSQAAWCSAAAGATAGAPRERTEEAGLQRRSRAEGGQRGREAETQARGPAAPSPRARSSQVRPHAGRGREGARGGASGSDTFSHLPRRTPVSGRRRGAAPRV